MDNSDNWVDTSHFKMREEDPIHMKPVHMIEKGELERRDREKTEKPSKSAQDLYDEIMRQRRPKEEMKNNADKFNRGASRELFPNFFPRRSNPTPMRGMESPKTKDEDYPWEKRRKPIDPGFVRGDHTENLPLEKRDRKIRTFEDVIREYNSIKNEQNIQLEIAKRIADATIKKRIRNDDNGLSEDYYELLDTFKKQTQDALPKLGHDYEYALPEETSTETPPAHKVEMKKLGVWDDDNDADESPFVNVNGVDVSMRNIDAKNGGDVQARAGIVKEMQDAMRKFYSED